MPGAMNDEREGGQQHRYRCSSTVVADIYDVSVHADDPTNGSEEALYSPKTDDKASVASARSWLLMTEQAASSNEASRGASPAPARPKDWNTPSSNGAGEAAMSVPIGTVLPKRKQQSRTIVHGGRDSPQSSEASSAMQV